MTNDARSELDLAAAHAISIAKDAGHYLITTFRADPELLKERGSSKEIVTRYDKESDQRIIAALTRAYPDHNLLTEESGRTDRGSPYTWVVDSLDGSGNYANSNPYFSVSIALLKDDEPILGVVYSPFLHELYVAEKGRGATLNGEPLAVSDTPRLANASLVTCEGNDSRHERIAKAYAALLPRVKDLRKIGSAALECCMVAAGRADGYLTFSIDPWDVAAGVLIAQEAGAKVTTFTGEDWRPQRTDLLVTNGAIHDELAAALNDGLLDE